MISELDAFRSVDFGYTRQLRSIWHDPAYHVACVHEARIADLIGYFASATCESDPSNEPLGRVIVGPAGYGKTHLVGELRRRIWEMGGWFVLLDFVGVKDFWSSAALGFLNSLQVRMPGDKTQYDRLVLKLASVLGIEQEMGSIAKHLREEPRALVTKLAQLFFRSLSRLHLQEAIAHRNVIIALILLVSEDFDCHSIAHAWLQGLDLDPADVRPLGFLGKNEPVKVVQGLTWIMSLTGPSLIAVDQIDAIVSASNAAALANGGAAKEEREVAQSIVEALAQGLMDLHEVKRRAVTVISCLEATWTVLKERSAVSVTDRYGSPAILHGLPNGETAKHLVVARLDQAYRAAGFVPPYPAWPFTETAFESAIGFSPRQLLKACEEHRQRCKAQGKVSACETFVPEAQTLEAVPPGGEEFDRAYEIERKAAVEIERKAAVVDRLWEMKDEEELRGLLDWTLRLFESHLDLPQDVDVSVQRDPDQKCPSLHGRLTFIFRSEGDREQHYCFRSLTHQNAIAFQTRLKAAMTASGIDTSLKFRHLFILRHGAAPGGARTKFLVDQFLKAGGKFIAPVPEDLRAFVALRAMADRNLPGFDAWLLSRRPLFDTALFKAAGLAPPQFLLSSPAPPEVSVAKDGPGPASEEDGLTGGARPQPVISSESSRVDGMGTRPRVAKIFIPIGRRFEHGILGDPVTLAAELLRRHIAILAGTGSGKTVLLRRIVEEAALLQIPAIVLDVNNDLSRLGDRWPSPPEGFTAEDAAKAATYHEHAEVVVWTPGVMSGNPLSFDLLPDFAAIGSKQDSQTDDERSQAVEMARATFAPYLGGTGHRAALKQGVLADALRTFASNGGGPLDKLIALLSDLPENVSKIRDAPKLASEIADRLLAALASNPLLQPLGLKLSPEQLFQARDGKTRISVINLAGLGSDEARQSFVNQLQMRLFTWIKNNPSPSGRLYVLDEAQNFAPSRIGTACKASTASLAQQARKYGLGMIFATQLPKGIDYAIVSNCTTHVYGRMSAPAAIEATQEIMAAKGGAAKDIGRLTTGEFYFSTEGLQRPVKIRTPLCLSWHPPNPPAVDEIVRKARTQAVVPTAVAERSWGQQEP